MDLDVSIMPELCSVLLLVTESGVLRLRRRLPKFLFLINRYAISLLIMYATSCPSVLPLSHRYIGNGQTRRYR
jgi:hypothetical protein